jgi:hypothetical protein
VSKRIAIPEEMGGGWVELRDSLSYAQKQRLDTAGTTVRRTELGVVVDDEINMYEHFIATVEAYVAGWSLDVPADRSGVESDALTEDVGEWLFEQIKEHRAATVRSKSGAA